MKKLFVGIIALVAVSVQTLAVGKWYVSYVSDNQAWVKDGASWTEIEDGDYFIGGNVIMATNIVWLQQ